MTLPDRPRGAGLAPAGGLWPAHIPRPVAPGPLAVPGNGGAPPPGQGGAVTSDELPPEVASTRWPWKGVQWSLTYVGFLGYIFAMTTYRFPIGDVSIVFALVGLLMQREPLRVPGLLKGLGVLILWGMVGYSLTGEPQLVNAKLQIILKLWLIALVAANALRTREQIRFFLAFWLACFAFYPVRGAIFNYYIYHENLFGRAIWNFIYANPNDLAAFCILMLSLAIGLFAIEQQKGPVRLGAQLGMAVVPFLILITKSRGAFLGFAVFLLFVLSGRRRPVRALALTMVIGGLVLAVAPAGVLDRVFALKNIESEGVAAADEEGSAAQRYEIWKVARTIIKDYPIVGVGLGAYPAYHGRYALRAQFNRTARGRRDTHSTYLNLTAETGFVGLFIFVASYIGLLLGVDKVRRRAKKLRPLTAQTILMLELGLLGFFTAATFGSLAHVSFLVLHAITVWCVAELVKKELDTATARRRRMASAPAPLSYASYQTR
jgi:O-antigen ligase